MAETFVRLNSAARRWAAEEGLGAFTVEQLCERAGVSRRTFFNYFASKEDAVLGVWVREDHGEAEAAFTAGGGELVDDLGELMVARWELAGLTPAATRELVAALQREPRLFTRLLELGAAREQSDMRLVEGREGWPAGDLRATTLVLALGVVLRSSVEELVAEENDRSVREAFTARLSALREVFTS